MQANVLQIIFCHLVGMSSVQWLICLSFSLPEFGSLIGEILGAFISKIFDRGIALDHPGISAKAVLNTSPQDCSTKASQKCVSFKRILWTWFSITSFRVVQASSTEYCYGAILIFKPQTEKLSDSGTLKRSDAQTASDSTGSQALSQRAWKSGIWNRLKSCRLQPQYHLLPPPQKPFAQTWCGTKVSQRKLHVNCSNGVIST